MWNVILSGQPKAVIVLAFKSDSRWYDSKQDRLIYNDKQVIDTTKNLYGFLVWLYIGKNHLPLAYHLMMLFFYKKLILHQGLECPFTKKTLKMSMLLINEIRKDV